MKKELARVIARFLILPMILSLVLCTGPLNPVWADEFDGSASEWAIPHIKQAEAYGLTYQDIMNNFKQPITREEFCTVVVKLYQKLSGKTVIAGSSPFEDTSNPEIIKAFQLEIVKGTGAGKFSPNLSITRQEICVMLFRALQKSVANLDKAATGEFPFEDQGLIASWALQEMKFAYKNSIMQGVSSNKIDPLSNTTREQAITLVKRTYEAFKPNSGSSTIPGSIEVKPGGGNTGNIEVKPGGENIGKVEIKPGTGGKDKIIIPGTDKAVQLIEGTVLMEAPKQPGLQLIGGELTVKDLQNLMSLPKYDTRIELYAATKAEKPVKKPKISSIDNNGDSIYAAMLSYDVSPIIKPNVIIKTTPSIAPVTPSVSPKVTITPGKLKIGVGSKESVYTNANNAAIIEREGNKKRWFAFNLKNAQGAKKVVWQVSNTSYIGFKDNWKKPMGLLKSGEVSASSGEFFIDFASFIQQQSVGTPYKIGSEGQLVWGGDRKYKEIPKAQKKLYIRAVPVDAAGNCIGDPGVGIEVLYGRSITDASQMELKLDPSFELWTPSWTGAPSYKPAEFPNLMQHVANTGVSCEESQPRYFMFKGYDTGASKVVLQVAQKPFTGKVAGWESPEGLAYTKVYDKLPVTEFCSGEWENSIPVDFKQFAPPASALKPGDKVLYYVRAVAVKPSGSAGSVSVAFSETITVDYTKQTPVKILTPQTVTAKSYIPTVNILKYQPIKKQDPYWAHYYVVYRSPKWYEINCKWKNVSTGQVLTPLFKPFGYPTQAEIEYYEKNVIPTVLKPGTKVSIFPKEESKSWWEDLWDAITDFFEGIVELAADLVNWASNAYAGLKDSIISFVANNLPGIPDSLRGVLKTALEALVNGGLMALGIPPTLPNFDELAENGLDYMAEIALTEAGVPSNEITKELIMDTAETIGSKVSEAYAKESPNPIDSPFLKSDPDYLEIPAYIEVELSNAYDKPSLPGSFNIDVDWNYTENVSIDSITEMDGFSAGPAAYMTHFLIGLMRGNTGGYPVEYPIFEPVRGQPIPVLQQGEKRVVRIYLQPCFGKPYSFASEGDIVREFDFLNLYNGRFGKADITVYTDWYELPDPKEAAKAQGFKEDSDHIYTYCYDKQMSGDGFTQIANKAYQP